MITRRVTRHAAISLVVFALCLVSCAKMGAPPGGPEDKTGPLLVSQYPDADAVNVSRKMVARLEFTEPVNRASVEASLFLSPDPRQRLRYRWHGNTLELIYLDDLEENRTYVITVGAQAKDIRGNPAGTPTTIAFSTGSEIDRGRIKGWIAGVESPQTVSLWAYQFAAGDSLDPMTRDADYRAQPLEDGTFEFGYLRSGSYRVLAAIDRDFDGLWNPSAELLGIPPWDVTVTDSAAPWISFRLANQDTAPPSIRAAKVINQWQIDLRLTTPVDSLSASFALGDTVVNAVEQYSDLDEPETWHVFPERELSAAAWIVIANGFSAKGVQWSDSEEVEIRARADTTRPVILRSDPDLEHKRRTLRETLRLEFAEPITLDSAYLDSLYYWSTDEDSGSVQLRALAPRVVDVVPTPSFTAGKNYILTFDGRAIRDLSGNSFADSTTELRFGFYSPDSLGSLRLDFTSDVSGQHLFDLFGAKEHESVERLVANAPGEIVFSNLPPGKYVIEIARDANLDSIFNPGTVTPWQFSEPFIMPPDTFSIRARWEQEMSITWPESR